MSHELVFYDGRCGLCHHSVRFLLARDRDGALFRYAPLFGETFGPIALTGMIIAIAGVALVNRQPSD